MTIVPPEWKRADSRTAAQLEQSSLVEDAAAQARARGTYQALSTALGFVHHAINGGVLDMPEAASLKLQEGMYQDACKSFGAQSNSSRMSAVLQRLSKHYALLGAASAVYRGTADFLPMEERLPDSSECALHLEALAAVPGDLDQMLHFTSLHSKNFDSFATLGLRIIAYAMLQLRVGNVDEIAEVLRTPDEDGFEPGGDVTFATKTGLYDSECSPDQATPWAFCLQGAFFRRTRNRGESEAQPRDMFIMSVRGKNADLDALTRFASCLLDELKTTDQPHSFPMDEMSVHQAVKKLYEGSAGQQALKFVSLGQDKGHALVVNVPALKRALVQDVQVGCAMRTVHAATPVGTMLLAAPQREEGRRGEDDRFHVAVPCRVEVPWHDALCHLSGPHAGLDVDQVVREGLASRRLAATVYNPAFWGRLGCTCFRSKEVRFARNPNFVDPDCLDQMRLREDEMRSARVERRPIRWPVELEQYYVRMIALGYNPFDEDTMDRYCPTYNRETWYATEGAQAMTPSDLGVPAAQAAEQAESPMDLEELAGASPFTPIVVAD